MSTSALATSNITSGFIDLATFDEQEKYMYGGENATAYFVRETRKSTWFTQVPVTLSRSAGSPGFGQEFSVNISRAGDYLLYTWLRFTLPSVTLSSSNGNGVDGLLRWTRNVAHNLVRECVITFNDLGAARFDNFHLDFWSAFTTPAGKLNGYKNMIGDTPDLTDCRGPNEAFPAKTLNLPLPLFFSRDSGVALPTAAIPYNEMRISFSLRDYTDLLILDDGTNATRSRPVVASDLTAVPVLSNVQVWGNYAIVSTEERKRMSCAPRDILIEQVQSSPLQSFVPATDRNPQYDIRLSHAIKCMLFGVRNTSNAAEWSNYTTGSPVVVADSIQFNPVGALDPIAETSLIYESTARLAQMGSDYFSLVQPYYHAPVIPAITGYHMYSYSLDFICLDPMGSTNYGKLSNVSVALVASAAAQTSAAGGGAADSGYAFAQTFQFVLTAVNNNIIRISGGAIGFPVL